MGRFFGRKTKDKNEDEIYARIVHIRMNWKPRFANYAIMS